MRVDVDEECEESWIYLYCDEILVIFFKNVFLRHSVTIT